ncbi:MAG: hypothetical protein Q8Q22_00375, partial [bacterium]|nr:hypothetical protein [bacterium]
MLMVSPIFSDGKEYISAIRAAKKIGYASDYIGQLCRAKKIPGQLIGKSWYVDFASLVEHKKNRQLGKVKSKIIDRNFAPTHAVVGAPTLLTSEPRSLNKPVFTYETDDRPRLPELSKKGRYIEPTWTSALTKQVVALTFSLLIAISAGFATLENTNPFLAREVRQRVENLGDVPKEFLKAQNYTDWTPKVAEWTQQQVAAVSFFSGIDKFFDNIIAGFRHLKEIALGKLFFVRSPIRITETPPPSTAVVAVTKPLDLGPLKSELKTELESFIRTQIDAILPRLGGGRSPIVVYSSGPVINQTVLRDEILLADTRPTVTRQSSSDVNSLSSSLARLADGGTFTNSSLTGATVSGPTGSFTNFTFSLATGTSATTTNFFSTTASSTNLFFTTGTGGNFTSTGLGTFGTLLANGSSTLQNLTFVNATGTSATTTNFFSTTASSTNLFSSNLIFGVGTTTGPFAITGAGSGLTFYGTGNHDITADAGTLRIGSNTIIGNIQALDDTVDIGTAGTRFDKIYANEVNASTLVGTLTGGNLTAETFSINSDNATADTEDANLAFERGSVSPNALITWDSAGNEFDFNSGVHITNTLVASSSLIIDTGNVGIGTTTPQYTLTIASTTASQLALSSGAGFAQWAFRNAGGKLYVATTTVAGDATSSVSALSLNANGLLTINSLTATGLGTFNNILTNASSTFQNLTFNNATGTSATTTSLFSTTASSTNLFSALLSSGSATFANLLVNSSTTLQNFTFTNATGTQATTTNLAVSSITSSLLKTGSTGSLLAALAGTDYENALTFSNGVSRSVNAVSVDQAFTPTWTGAHIFNNITRSTTTSATTTNFFATTASSTNLFTSLFTLNGFTLSSTANGTIGGTNTGDVSLA